MRATAPSTTDVLFKFTFPLIQARPIHGGVLSIVGLTALIILTYSILGFTSTILLSDVVVQPIPAGELVRNIPLDYLWNEAGQKFDYNLTASNSYWRSGKPLVLPAFAEYSMDAPKVQGVADTGRTIRAFLPFIDSNDRTRLKDYTGRAVVWDARVVCQKPIISNNKTHIDEDGYTFALSGNVRKPVDLDIIIDAQPEAARFWCGIIRAFPTGKPVICQLPNSDVGNTKFDGSITLPTNYAGGLKSEFRTNLNGPRNGAAYLILNYTDSTKFMVDDYLIQNPEWTPVGAQRGYGIVLATLCYTSLDVVDRNVTISGSTTRTEPAFGVYENHPEWFTGWYTYDAAFAPLLPGNPRQDPRSRGILDLGQPPSGWAQAETKGAGSDGPWDPQSNLTGPTQLHFISDALALRDQKPDYDEDQLYGNYSVVLDDKFIAEENRLSTSSYLTSGKTWMGDLFVAVKNHPQGNAAFALQALLTAIASNAFYDTLPLFDRFDNISMVSFRNVSSAGGPYGTRRGSNLEFSDEQLGLFSNYVKGRFPVGYAIIAVVLGCQIILTAIIFIRFMRETELTRIGDPWQALAQVASGELEGLSAILEASRKVRADRETVAKEVEIMGEDGTRVGVEQHDGSAHLRRRTGGIGDAEAI
ncbi:hypothetical protein ABW20_dc0108107 [Dactylellina cionopaga]|nr:hypothetical protein ABW20_dc0108107 [Dactylellina cionopaga]